MLDPVLRPAFEGALARVARAVPPRISANAVTLGGFCTGLIATGLVAADWAPFALVPLILARIADGVDGAVARLRGPTALGAFLDASLDVLAYATLPMGFAILVPDSALAAAFVVLSFLGMMTVELCFRLCVGKNAIVAPPLIGNSETFIVFAIACVYPPAFAPLCYLFGIACFVAAGVRVADAVTQLNDAPP